MRNGFRPQVSLAFQPPPRPSSEVRSRKWCGWPTAQSALRDELWGQWTVQPSSPQVRFCGSGLGSNMSRLWPVSQEVRSAKDFLVSILPATGFRGGTRSEVPS